MDFSTLNIRYFFKNIFLSEVDFKLCIFCIYVENVLKFKKVFTESKLNRL